MYKIIYTSLCSFLALILLSSCAHKAIPTPENNFGEADNLRQQIAELESSPKVENENLTISRSSYQKPFIPIKRELSLIKKAHKKKRLPVIKKQKPKIAKILSLKKSTPSQTEIFQQKLSLAVELFNERNWQKAYLKFAELDRSYSPEVTQGICLYWMARCWFQMNEYHIALSFLQHFLDQFPTSKYVDSAKIFSAKSEYAMGNSSEGQKTLEEVILRSKSKDQIQAARQILEKEKQKEFKDDL